MSSSPGCNSPRMWGNRRSGIGSTRSKTALYLTFKQRFVLGRSEAPRRGGRLCGSHYVKVKGFYQKGKHGAAEVNDEFARWSFNGCIESKQKEEGYGY